MPRTRGDQNAGSTTVLTVWRYDSAMGAAAGEVRLKDLQRRGAVTVDDAVTITWMRGAHEPRVGHLRHPTLEAATQGSLLGALVGTLVLAPAAGAVPDAGPAGLSRRLRGTGLDERFLEELKNSLSPGTSVLLVLSRDADLDVVRPFVERGLARGDVTLMQAHLPEGAPEALRRLVEDAAAPGDADGPGAEGPR